MAIQVNDVIRVVAKFTWNNVDEIANVFHFLATSVTDGDVTAWAGWLENHVGGFYENIKTYISNKVTADSVELFNVTQNAPIDVVPFTVFTGGAATGDALPPGTAPVLTFPTPYSRTFGRKFLPPFTETSQNAGILASTPLADLATEGAGFVGSKTLPTLGTGVFGVWSDDKARFGGHSAVLVRDQLGYQRRRKPGVGS